MGAAQRGLGGNCSALIGESANAIKRVVCFHGLHVKQRANHHKVSEGDKMENESVIATERRFQVWSYAVGHSQLLLRSVKSAAHEARIEVLFKNVSYIALPTLLDGVRIEKDSSWTDPTASSRERFRVITKQGEGYVLAGAVAVNEDRGDFFEASPLMQLPQQEPHCKSTGSFAIYSHP